MALTAEQLETIKTKIKTESVPPKKVIRDLFPNEDWVAVRKQLFDAYDKNDLISKGNQKNRGISKEERLARAEKQLARIEKRKATLLEEKAKLEAEE
jgi:hypothetical protein